MGNLLNTIPVRPQQTPAARPAVQQPVLTASINPLLNEIQNKFPQDKIYKYIPAMPVSPPRTAPAGIKARKASGELIKENMFQSAASTVKSYGDYVKYFYKAAFKGEGKDYSVGKINDLSLRVGSLGIATVLATSKMFPFAKGMEFVGLATWFASMAVWPKILGAPIKAIYGVDINQKYKDSEGRRKYVYEDNQYRPMDIFRYVDTDGTPLSEEEYHAKYDRDYVYLEKMGDKLGIPRNIKNRNEATMNKMGQVAVQGKTLWMLTAGVMTPVLSSIAADALQAPLKNSLESYRYKKQSGDLKKLEQTVEMLLGDKNHPRITDIDQLYKNLKIKIPESVQKEFASLIPENGELNEEQFKKLNDYLEKRFYGSGMYTSIEAAMKKDSKMTEPFVTVNNEFRSELSKITKDSLNEVLEKLPENLRNTLPEEILNYQGMSTEQVDNLLKDLYLDNISDLNKVRQDLLSGRFSMRAIEPLEDAKQNNTLAREFVDRYRKVMNSKLDALYESKRHYIVSKQQIEKIFKFAEINRQMTDRLNKFARATIKNISESATAISWENVPQKYLKVLGFTNKELAVLATVDSKKAARVVAEKFANIVEDEQKYKKVLQTMSKYAQEAVSKEEKAVIQLIGTIEKPGVLFKIKELMESSAHANFGGYFQDSINTYYLNKVAAAQRKLRNTMDSFVRPIKALDVFKHADDLAKTVIGDKATFKNRMEKDWHYQMFKGMNHSRAKASVIKYLKDIVLQKNDINNWTTKMEAELPLAKRGLKNSMPVLCSVADQIFGELHPDTASIITAGNNEKAKAFVEKININNWIMKAKFLRLDYKLSEKGHADNNYMSQKNAFGGYIENLRNPQKANEAHRFLSEILHERMADIGENIAPGSQRLTFEKLRNYQKILNDFINGATQSKDYNINDSINCLKESGCFQYKASNKSIAEISGKNITDFLSSAAQNVRSRNKWLKLVYGLLTGTIAVSVFTIAKMGKKNNLNKDIYEYKTSSQGALK